MSIRATTQPAYEIPVHTGIINSAVLVEYTFDVFLQPASILDQMHELRLCIPTRRSTYRLLSAHDEVTSASDDLFVRVLGVHESQNGPRCLDHLGFLVLRIHVGHARLQSTPISDIVMQSCLRALTMYVSPHPPSSI